MLQNLIRSFHSRLKKYKDSTLKRSNTEVTEAKDASEAPNTDKTNIRHIIAYDIGCQYCRHFVERISASFPDIEQYAELIEFLVGKMHLQGHIYDCQYRYSFNYTSGTGRTDGEEIERFWSEIIMAAGSTKQMNPGHRHDTLDDLIGDWNWIKLCELGQWLSMPAMYSSLTSPYSSKYSAKAQERA